MTHTEKAQSGLKQVKEAILGFLHDHPNGATNAEIGREHGLESDFEGENHNYLCWSIIGLLVNEGTVRRERRGRSRVYFSK